MTQQATEEEDIYISCCITYGKHCSNETLCQKQLGVVLFGLCIINQGLLRETNAGTHHGKGL